MPDEHPYVIGPSRARKHPTVETKPRTWLPRQRRWDTGGGYERARSTEVRPHTSRQGSEDVYAAIHRLCMVAWWDDEDATAEDVLPHLTGRDVHHESGVEWDNREDNLVLMDHGRHSEITQAQIRAWGEDAKRQATADGGETPAEDSCAECDATEHLYRCADYDGLRCAVHAAQASDGSPMEAV